MIESYDISKTFKTTQSQLYKLKEVEKIMGYDQSRAIRFLLDIGYSGFTAVRSPNIASMKDEVGLWKIPIFEELSAEAIEETLQIWQKELGWKVDTIRRQHERGMARYEKQYETNLRTRPIHKSRWGTGDIAGIPMENARKMIQFMEINLELLKTYAGMKKEYELRTKKKLPTYGQFSQHTADRLLYKCLDYPGHDLCAPSIVRIAQNQKAKNLVNGAKE